jgi:hypothetical protein
MDEILRPMVRTQQIIVGSLLTGCTVFLGVVLVLLFSGIWAPAPAQFPALEMVLTMLAGGALVARVVAPTTLTAAARKRMIAGTWTAGPNAMMYPRTQATLDEFGDQARLAVVHQTKTIIASAILEGVVFFALIIVLLEGSMYALGVALIFMALIAAEFPTMSRVQAWIDAQLRLIDEQRQFEGGPSS